MNTVETLKKFLQVGHGSQIEDLLVKALIDPLENVLSRPGKNIRASLVRFGFEAASGRESEPHFQFDDVVDKTAAVVELLHAGSLVIDDIQDGSAERRGAPSVHAQFGLPVALNAGNWLYFVPFQIVESLPIEDSRKKAFSDGIQRTLMLAHQGQALDVAIPFDSIPQVRVPQVSAAAIELKTGALSALACKAGPLVMGRDPALSEALESFGSSFGIALQMFDDIGNAVAEKNYKKWADDVHLRRLTFVSAVAAELLSESDFTEFKLSCGSNRHLSAAREFLVEKGVIAEARLRAGRYLLDAIKILDQKIRLSHKEFELLQGLQRTLMTAYE